MSEENKAGLALIVTFGGGLLASMLMGIYCLRSFTADVRALETWLLDLEKRIARFGREKQP